MPSVQALEYQLRRAGAPATIRLLHHRELQPLTTVVATDEQVIDAAMGTFQGRPSIVLLTDRRCVVASTLAQQPAVTVIPYAAIGSVTSAAEFLVGSLTLGLAGGEVTITDVCPGGYAQRFAAHIAAHVAPT